MNRDFRRIANSKNSMKRMVDASTCANSINCIINVYKLLFGNYAF